MAGAWFAGVLSDEFPDIDGKWDSAPLPEGPAGCKTTIAGDALIMLNQTESSDAAWLWMEYLSRPHQLARRSEEHTSELQSRQYLVCRLLLEKKNLTTTVLYL